MIFMTGCGRVVNYRSLDQLRSGVKKQDKQDNSGE